MSLYNELTTVGTWEYVPLGGFVILVSNSAVEQTGLVASAFYEVSMVGGLALCRWDTTAAAIADGSFTFAVPDGARFIVQNVTGNTLLNVIEGSADSAAGAALFLSEVRPR